MNFKELHNQKTPLLICNVWDVPSAKAAEALNFTAIGTSSAAVAAVLGYADGEEMSFGELVYMVERIAKSVSLPLSVDMEAGYGSTPEEVVENIAILVEHGVKGINLEDSLVRDGKRNLKDAEEFGEFLSAIASTLKTEGKEVFLNVRTDAFLLGMEKALEETLSRGKLYQEAGADGIFAPCITQPGDIRQVVEQLEKPVNVMCMPDLPDFKTLTDLGVKRISMGNFCFHKMEKDLKDTLQKILTEESFGPLFQ